jgi:succinylarginine dihydrolase
MLLYHQTAFADTAGLIDWIRTNWRGARKPAFVEVATADVSVDDAVRSYLFNSQLVCPPDGSMRLIAASECEENPRVWAQIQRIVESPDNPLTQVHVFDLRQSMRNGGGPACLRLRVVLTEAERGAVNPGSWIDDARYEALAAWVRSHYRDRLVLADLGDPALLDETRTALDRLTQILGIGSVYDFQR